MSKPVSLNGKVFGSQSAAAAYACCDRSTMCRAVKNGTGVWVRPLGKTVVPRCAEGEPPESSESPVTYMLVKCPCCEKSLMVKVSVEK